MIKILSEILRVSDDSDLRIVSARLLFDMHNRESLLFCDAFSSYLVTDHKSVSKKVDELLPLGTLSDKEKLFVKMHQGRLTKDEKDTLLKKLSDIADDCLLRGDPSEPHRCFQRITYSTGKYWGLLIVISTFVGLVYQ